MPHHRHADVDVLRYDQRGGGAGLEKVGHLRPHHHHAGLVEERRNPPQGGQQARTEVHGRLEYSHPARTPQPMVPLGLFRSRTFSGANAMTLLLYAPSAAPSSSCRST